MILTAEDIGLLEESGELCLKDRLDLGAISVDVRVDKLFQLDPKGYKMSALELPYEEFKEQFMIEVPLSNNTWLLQQNKHFLGETLEELILPPELTACLTTRSSWGRYGVYLKHTADELDTVGQSFKGKIPFIISTYGTEVLLRPKDTPGQITFCYNSKFPLFELNEMIDHNLLQITRNEQQLQSSELEYSGGIVITLDDSIKLYTGGIIDPTKHVSDHFEDIDLSDGFRISKGQFFVTSSRESVKINRGLVGWVAESDYWNPNTQPSMRPQGITTQKTHPNAPRIDPYPIFQGKITFENLAYTDLHLQPEQRLSRLNLYLLSSPLTQSTVSRYYGQDKATASKGNLDTLK